jgi:hypothetical protein
MSEWQPARLILFHYSLAELNVDGEPIEQIELLLKKVVRVRLFPEISEVCKLPWRIVGCAAERFYKIHPQDRDPGCGDIVCEHEVLTD